MTKKDLSSAVAEEFRLTKTEGDKIITYVFDKIQEQLIQQEEVSIAGFGKFTVSERAAHPGINPATKEPIQVAASKSAKFKPAKQLKDALN